MCHFLHLIVGLSLSYLINNLLQIQVGNANYNCSCSIRYTAYDKIWLIVSLCGGFGLLLIIVIIIIIIVVVACRKRNNKRAEEREERNIRSNCQQGQSSMDAFELDDRNYWTIPADSAENPSNVYCSAHVDEPVENKVYTSLEKPEPPPQQTSDNATYYSSINDDEH